MYAIIRAGGHQEKVEAGEVITVDRRREQVGASITFTPLMIHQDDGTVVSDRSALGEGDASVVATVLQHTRADKIDVFQYRNKTGYRRHIGHRQPLTLLEIAEIRFGGTVVTAPEPPPQEEAPSADGTDGKSTPPAKKKAAKKKTTAAKKTTAKKRAPAKKKTAKAAPTKETAAEDEAPAPEPTSDDDGNGTDKAD